MLIMTIQAVKSIAFCIIHFLIVWFIKLFFKEPTA